MNNLIWLINQQILLPELAELHRVTVIVPVEQATFQVGFVEFFLHLFRTRNRPLKNGFDED